MMKYILIFTNDFHKPDNIHGRIQTKIFNTYEEAYEEMKKEVLNYVEKQHVDAILNGLEFTDMYLGEDVARIHKDFGQLNYYWKIVEV